MSFAARQENRDFKIPAEIDWHMLDKSRFFVLGAALFSAVSGALYPAVVLKTRQQVSLSPTRCSDLAHLMLRREGLKSFYRGFPTSLAGTVPARALYMTALEITKTTLTTTALRLGLSDATSAAFASSAAGLTASVAAQLVWTPVDVVSQRLMVAGTGTPLTGAACCKKIILSGGIRELYRGFGVSILTYAPSSALWWGSYSVAHRVMWAGSGWEFEAAGQVAAAAVASGVSAVVTTPLDTVKTRMQVSEGGRRTFVETVAGLVREGGIRACYRGFGPRWASMSMSSATMVTTYELLKKLSTKHQERYC